MKNKVTNLFSKVATLCSNIFKKKQTSSIEITKKPTETDEMYSKIKTGQINLEVLNENQIEDILNNLHEEIKKQTTIANKRIETLIEIRHHNKELEENKTIETYELVKNEDVNLNDLSKEELIRIRILFSEELKLYIEKNEKEKNNNKVLLQKIKKISSKNQNCLKQEVL